MPSPREAEPRPQETRPHPDTVTARAGDTNGEKPHEFGILFFFASQFDLRKKLSDLFPAPIFHA